MAFCQRCGKEVPPDATFCPACGLDLRTSLVRPESGPLFARPVIRLGRIDATANLGRQLDLKRLSKSFGEAPILKPNSLVGSTLVRAPTLLVRFQNSGIVCLIGEAGAVSCTGARTSDLARSALNGILGQLKVAVKIGVEPTVQSRISRTSAFFGRGIRIEAVPDRVPDSLFLSSTMAPGPAGQVRTFGGKYNREGLVHPVSTSAEASAAMRELGAPPVPTPFAAYWRIPSTSAVASMPRGVDRAGQMLRTGFVTIWRAESEAQVYGWVSEIAAMLEREGLYTPLTPLDQIPAGGRSDPRAFDYFAEDPTVWCPQPSPR